MGVNQYSKEKFIQLLEAKTKTAAIGTLASIEESFGKLWGHDQNDPSEGQMQNREAWQQLRTEILDKIHEQKRQLINELEQYQMEWTRYQVEFLPLSAKPKECGRNNFGNY